MPWTFRPDEHVPPSRLIQQTRAGLLIGTGVRRSDDRFVVLKPMVFPMPMLCSTVSVGGSFSDY